MKLVPAILILFVGVALGAGIGLMVATEPADTEELEAAQKELVTLRLELDSLKRQAAYSSVATPGGPTATLNQKDILAFNKQLESYIGGLRRRGFLSVSDAFRWFQKRWVEVLGAYAGVEGRRARAEVMAKLLVSVRSSIDPNDFITWQVEWLSFGWLPELQRDIDGDGLPARRRDKAEAVELVPATVCRVAMELNLLVRDASVLVAHGLPCSEGAPRVSGLLTGKTYDKILDSFVRLMKESGYGVVDNRKGKTRTILVGAKR